MICKPPQSVMVRRGFTLVEVLLAVTLAAFIGAAVLVMLGAATSATAVQADSRKTTLSRQIAAERLGSLVRSSKRPLFVSADRLLLWVADRNGNDTPELSEMRLIRWSQGQQRAELVEAAAGAPPSPDTAWALTDDFGAVAGVVGSTLPSRALLVHLVELEFSLDTSDARTARRVRIRVASESAAGIDHAIIIATPRGVE